jgi:tetratricopeptide (TPR) repeat protein
MESEERHPSAQIVERLADVFDIPAGQRKPFLRFSQGDWQAGHNYGEFEDADLDVSRFTTSPNLPRSMMNFIGADSIDGLLELTQQSPHMTEKLALIQQARELAESSGDVRRQMETLWQLGWLDQTNRSNYWEKALSIARKLGDAQVLASGLSMMGFFLVLNGDLHAAQKYLSESSALYQQLQLKPVASHLLSAYGQISLIRGDFKKARAYLQEHAQASLGVGNREDYLWSNVRLGYVALCEGNLDEARHIFVESAQEFKKDKNAIGVVFTLEGLASFYASKGKPLQATRLIGWADSTREKISDKRPLLEQTDVDKIIVSCLARVGKARFARAYAEGQKMTMDVAISYALTQTRLAER